MSILFSILAFILFILFVIALIKPSVFTNTDKKTGEVHSYSRKQLLPLFGVFFLVFLILASVTSSKGGSSTQKSTIANKSNKPAVLTKKQQVTQYNPKLQNSIAQMTHADNTLVAGTTAGSQGNWSTSISDLKTSLNQMNTAKQNFDALNTPSVFLGVKSLIDQALNDFISANTLVLTGAQNQDVSTILSGNKYLDTANSLLQQATTKITQIEQKY